VRAALALARTLSAELVLMDDRVGVAVAQRQGFTVTGTLGVLDLAAQRGLVDLADAFARLRATSFRYPPEMMDALLASIAKGIKDDGRQSADGSAAESRRAAGVGTGRRRASMPSQIPWRAAP
jgi:hypothetical protein